MSQKQSEDDCEIDEYTSGTPNPHGNVDGKLLGSIDSLLIKVLDKHLEPTRKYYEGKDVTEVLGPNPLRGPICDDLRWQVYDLIAHRDKLIEARARLDEQQRTDMHTYDDGITVLRVFHPTLQHMERDIRIDELKAEIKRLEEVG